MTLNQPIYVITDAAGNILTKLGGGDAIYENDPSGELVQCLAEIRRVAEVRVVAARIVPIEEGAK